jgi:hypothetical protein
MMVLMVIEMIKILAWLCSILDGDDGAEDNDHDQRPRKHFESGGALTKRGTFVYDQNQTIL